MATKSYSKHKEFKEYSTSSKNVPYTDEQFDMLKTELIPKGSKLESITRNGGPGAGTREYHYEYKEEKHPSGKYDRKDLHTVEEYTIPPKTVPKNKESSSYFYEREERSVPAVTGTRTYNYESSSSNTPGYSKVKSSKATKDLSHNVDELDSLLDDLQKDQERQLYKSGYTSDTAESSSFDYRRATPVKAPSSGYSTLKREERMESSHYTAPAPVVKQELRQEMFREETHESRVVPSQISPAQPLTVPAPVCAQCHHHTSNTLSRSSTPMNKVTTTVKTYTYEVPAGADPAAVPLPLHADHQHTYLSNTENIRSTSTPVPASPALGCQYCSHCNTRVSYNVNNVNEYHTRHTTSSDKERTNERIVYPTPVNETKHLSPQPLNGQPNHGPSTYKFSETSYSHSSTRERSPPPFPRPHTPSPSTQQPPKKLDDLLADFPEARFPTQPDGVTRRRIEVSHESSKSEDKKSLSPASKNTAGPAVYYPPGHVPFQNKPESAAYQASAMQGGGSYAAGRGMYEYESGAKSKEKHSEKKTAVPVCLPLCCAMPCVIL